MRLWEPKVPTFTTLLSVRRCFCPSLSILHAYRPSCYLRFPSGPFFDLPPPLFALPAYAVYPHSYRLLSFRTSDSLVFAWSLTYSNSHQRAYKDDTRSPHGRILRALSHPFWGTSLLFFWNRLFSQSISLLSFSFLPPPHSERLFPGPKTRVVPILIPFPSTFSLRRSHVAIERKTLGKNRPFSPVPLLCLSRQKFVCINIPRFVLIWERVLIQ